MAKSVTAFDLQLRPRKDSQPLGPWLYDELRESILTATLARGTRLPSSRELASEYGVARGTVTAVYEQLSSEGYLESRTGAGTFVSDNLPEEFAVAPPAKRAEVRPAPSSAREQPVRPFRPYEPAVDHFPIELWTRLTGRRLRQASSSMFTSGTAAGYQPLRDTVAAYIGTSRGVRCHAGQVVIVSGTQQALDLVTRVLIRRGDAVWMEDPGYGGATETFLAAGAAVVPVAVDAHGFRLPVKGRSRVVPKMAYVTPAHQFPLGMTMPLERRLALLDWAHKAGTQILEDDYDSEFRYAKRPVPALQGLDRTGSVIYMGSFNKVLFPSLRIGYLVVPENLLDPILNMRSVVDRFTPTLPQAILTDFIVEGHFGRHLRRMREVYGERLAALREAVELHLADCMTLPDIQAGLHIAADLRPWLSADRLEKAAAAVNMEVMSLSRFVLAREDINAVLLGFGAFRPEAIRKAVIALAGLARSLVSEISVE